MFIGAQNTIKLQFSKNFRRFCFCKFVALQRSNIFMQTKY